MATALENLQTRRESICAELAALGSSLGVPDTTKAGSVPNKSGDGINMDHVGYKQSLYAELKMIDEQIAALQGPFEVISGVQI